MIKLDLINKEDLIGRVCIYNHYLEQIGLVVGTMCRADSNAPDIFHVRSLPGKFIGYSYDFQSVEVLPQNLERSILEGLGSDYGNISGLKIGAPVDTSPEIALNILAQEDIAEQHLDAPNKICERLENRCERLENLCLLLSDISIELMNKDFFLSQVKENDVLAIRSASREIRELRERNEHSK